MNGLAYFGAQLVVAADDDGAVDAFAVEMRKHRGLRSFVGPKEVVEGLWARVRHGIRSRRSCATSSRCTCSRRRRCATPARTSTSRRARPEEAELVADHSGAMILGELGYDPRANRAGFAASVRRAIAHGLWWVWVVDGTLRFQLNVGPRTAATAQLQGVWTPPEQRGHGYASLALAAVARRLFATETTLSLYVNDFNAPAIALYERLGFSRAGTFATYLFP